MGGTIPIGASELALASLLILANAAASVVFRLELGRRLALSALRAGLQLALLGFVLHWIFALDRWPLVVGLMLAMGLLAGFEAVRRTTRRVAGLRAIAVGAMLVASMAVTLYATDVVLRVDPWYEPRYLVPILGMILGNALNGISLGLETALAGYVTRRDEIELLLAHGATRAEAARDVVRDSVRTGLIPILNTMAAAGAISIPGMMTGQILAGQPPASAAAYQVFILLCIAGATALGTVAVVLGTTRLVFDARDRLRVDRIARAGGA
jgi:UDP-glucose/iron transport system permease protein